MLKYSGTVYHDRRYGRASGQRRLLSRTKEQLRARSRSRAHVRCLATSTKPVDAVLPELFFAWAARFLPSIGEGRSRTRSGMLALPQGRQLNHDYIQTVEEILAEFSFFHELAKIDVGGCDDANVYLNLLYSAQMHELAVLQDTKILLCVSRLIVPISSRNRVPRSATSNRPFLDGDRLVNAPFTCAEERGLEEIRWNGAGIDRDETADRVAASSRELPLQSASLPVTTLALQQDGGTAGLPPVQRDRRF